MSPPQPPETTARHWLETTGGLEADVVAARVDGVLVDLHAPVAGTPVRVEPVRARDPDALALIRHSSAHVMADAVQRLFPGTKVAFGPATDAGFFYDYDRPGGTFSDEDLRLIEARMAEIIAGDHPFRREVVSVPEARALLTRMGETYKLEHLERLAAQGETISLYRHGDWVDLCEGPHVPSTRFLQAFKLTSVAGAYWRGDERNPMLQRIYGTAFATRDALEEHLKQIEEAKQRDHRKLGKELELFLFDEVAPAMPFFLPRGAYVYNRLVEYMRALYVDFGYEEVITPQVFDPKLFRTSGHLGNYNENMYRLWTEDVLAEAGAAPAGALQAASFGLKPMNCPSHCVIFGARKRSYRELPWRVADFGRLHRYERGGVVHGLSRVRTFCQDDAHIFCTTEQVPQEIARFLELFYRVYRDFGLTKIDVRLATRPDKRIGRDEEWDQSERALRVGLEQAGLPFEISEGEGAFYGPKLEFHVQDALKRSWQLGTMQYDPNLPERFELAYTGADGRDHRPVMLHRAVFGTFERFLSVYLEHSGGNFPLWLAPEQVRLVTVSEKVEAYAREVLALLRAEGLRAEADFSSDKLGAKIRAGRLMRVPYLAVVGEKEAQARALALRSRDENKDLGALPLEAVVRRLTEEAIAPSERRA